MAKVDDGIDADMAAWIERQPVFFVATAPLAADGLVNLSPEGADRTSGHPPATEGPAHRSGDSPPAVPV